MLAWLERVGPLAGRRDGGRPRGRGRVPDAHARGRSARRAGRRAARRRGQAAAAVRHAGGAAAAAPRGRAPRRPRAQRARASWRRASSPRPAELGLEVGDHGEPDITLYTLWDPEPRAGVPAPARRRAWFTGRAASSAATAPGPSPCPPTRRSPRRCPSSWRARPAVRVDERVAEVLDELVGRARAGVRDGRALLRRGRRARRPRAGRRAAPLPARRRALRARAAAHVHRRRAGARQDRPGARHARGRRGLPGGRGLPGEHEADVGARGSALAAEAHGGRARRPHRGDLDRGGRRGGDRRAQLRHPRRARRAAGQARRRARSCSTSPTT